MSDFFELTTNSLLAKIAPQPDDQRRFIVLVGYVLVDEASKSETPTVRVYLELDLRTYLEVQIGDVVWVEKAIPGQESSPTKLVINAAAKVNRVTTARHVETEFLGGIIASSCLPTAASGSAVNVWINQDRIPSRRPVAPGREEAFCPEQQGGIRPAFTPESASPIPSCPIDPDEHSRPWSSPRQARPAACARRAGGQ